MYGWYLGAFLEVIGGLWARRKQSRVLAWITISLFMVTTLNLVFCATNEYNAWIKHTAAPGVAAYLGLANIVPIRWISYFLIELAEVLADTLLIWRLYVIWNKNKLIIILPAILLASDFAMGTVIWLMAMITGITGRASRFTEAFFVLSIANSTCAIVLNVFSTSLVISRLWWDSRRASTPHTRGLYKAVIVSLVESGALFTTTLIIYAAFTFVEMDGLAALFQYFYIMVIAIAPLFIVIHLNASFPAPLVHSSVSVDMAPPTSGFGAGFRKSVGDKAHPSTRRALSPIESFKLKAFRSSRPQDHSRLRSPTSTQTGRTWGEIPVTVTKVSTTVTEMRVRLSEDQDVEKGDLEREEEEGVSTPPSSKFVKDLDYFLGNERSDE
ncbi:hypothetical protein FRB96_006915 [Tulasnella sp. 330]|nr:hypothetical protein FRB96_006915 [Tulasnella sp. 330]